MVCQFVWSHSFLSQLPSEDITVTCSQPTNDEPPSSDESDDCDTVLTTLYFLERFAVSDECYHERLLVYVHVILVSVACISVDAYDFIFS